MSDTCPDEVEPFDDDRDLDFLKDDGWTNGDILARRHRVDGEYLGPKA